MRARRRWLVGSVLAGGIALAVFLSMQGGRGQGGDAGGGGRDPGAPPGAGAAADVETAPALRPPPTASPPAGEGASPTEPTPAEAGTAPVPAGGLYVEVVGAGGVPVATALFRLLQDKDGRPARRGANLIGAWVYAVPAVLPSNDAPVWLEVLRPKDAAGAALPLASVLEGPIAPGTETYRVTLPVESVLAGRVLDAEGLGLEGAGVIALLDVGKGAAWEEHGKARTVADGAFRIGGLREGLHRLEVAPVGPNARPALVEAVASREDIVLRCRPGRVVDLVFADADGTPVPGCRVRLGETLSRGPGFGMGSDAGVAETDEAGRVHFEGLDPAYGYILEADPPRERKDVVPLKAWSWKAESGTIRLRRALVVAGRVQHEDGRPFRYAHVDVHPKEEGMLGLSGSSKEDGRFVVERVPEGAVYITADLHRSDAERWVSRRMEARAGDRDVVIVMRPDPIGPFEVSVEDWPGDGAEETAWLFSRASESEPGSAQSYREPMGADGKVRFSRVNLHRRFTFYVSTPDGSRVAWEHGIEGKPGAAVVRLQPAFAIQGRVEAPEGATGLRVYASAEGISRGGEVQEDGSFVVRGLFEATWRVGASAKLDGRHLSTRAQVAAGGSVDLALEAPAAVAGGR